MRLLKLIVNWFLVLTAPMWFGWAFLVFAIIDLITGYSKFRELLLGGDRFLWE